MHKEQCDEALLTDEEMAEVEYWQKMSGEERFAKFWELQREVWGSACDERMDKTAVRFTTFDETEDT